MSSGLAWTQLARTARQDYISIKNLQMGLDMLLWAVECLCPGPGIQSLELKKKKRDKTNTILAFDLDLNSY